MGLVESQNCLWRKFYFMSDFPHKLSSLKLQCDFSIFIKYRWNKLIQKPFEEGDERGLKLVQSILKTIMLRRTKFSTDREGR